MVSTILFLGTQMAVGGAQRLLFSQAQWFSNREYEVITAFFYDKENLSKEWKDRYPFPVINLGAWNPRNDLFSNGFRLLKGFIQLWRIIKKERIDVIETFTPDSNVLGLFIAWLAGVPVRIGSHHGNIEGAGKFRQRIHGWVINSNICQRLVVVSKQVQEITIHEEGVIPDKVVVILNGIDPVADPDEVVLRKLRDDIGIKPGDFVYITISRLTIQKGHTHLLDAIPSVLETFPEDSKFLFIGDGHQKSILADKIMRLGLSEKVQLLGTRKEIPELLSLADVFVLPSLWEGLPLALLEAMSVGLPVVATRVEGVESIIIDGENGFLVAPKDSEALARALINIRLSQDTFNSFSRKNAELVKEAYTNERMCVLYESLFKKCYSKVIRG